jgi:predicted nucleic acid-binding protein
MVKIPHADEGAICPLHKVDISTVCHKCPWWTRVIGKNPQSEEMIDDWRCAIALLPMLLVENAQMQRQSGAAIETLRNGLVEGVTQAVSLAADMSMGRLTDARNNRR